MDAGLTTFVRVGLDESSVRTGRFPLGSNGGSAKKAMNDDAGTASMKCNELEVDPLENSELWKVDRCLRGGTHVIQGRWRSYGTDLLIDGVR